MCIESVKKSVMRRSKITPYEVAKLNLISSVNRIEDVETMINDGRIRRDEVFVDVYGSTYLDVGCIKRLSSNGV